MPDQDTEIQQRLTRASMKVRLQGVFFVLVGTVCLAVGYFNNTSSQRQFNERMNSGSNLGPAANKVIDNVPPLQVGRALSSPLFQLMMFVVMGFGLIVGVIGAAYLLVGLTGKKRGELTEEYRIEAKTSELRASGVENSTEPRLRYDGVYKHARVEPHLRFYPNGTVAQCFAFSGITPIRFFIKLEKAEHSDCIHMGTYSVNGDRVSAVFVFRRSGRTERMEFVIGLNTLTRNNEEWSFGLIAT